MHELERKRRFQIRTGVCRPRSKALYIKFDEEKLRSTIIIFRHIRFNHFCYYVNINDMKTKSAVLLIKRAQTPAAYIIVPNTEINV